MLRPGCFFLGKPWGYGDSSAIPHCINWTKERKFECEVNKEREKLAKNIRKGSQARTMFRFGTGGLHKSGNGEISWSIAKVYCCKWQILTAGSCLCVNSAWTGPDWTSLDLAGDGWKCTRKTWLVNSGKRCWKQSDGKIEVWTCRNDEMVVGDW